MDPAQKSGSKCIQLICWLDDKHLPCVPPVLVIVPTDYPSVPPRCVLSSHEYATAYLSAVQQGLDARLAKLPKRFSVSQLLDTWEMSVRQASAPKAHYQENQNEIQEKEQQQKSCQQPQEQQQQPQQQPQNSVVGSLATGLSNGTATVQSTASVPLNTGVSSIATSVAPVPNSTLILNGLPSTTTMITMAST